MNKENMWVLGCPTPNCGELAKGYYNAGAMLADDRNGVTEEDSKMQIISNVVEMDFDNYINLLKDKGIKGYLEHELGKDKFFAFDYEGNYYHVSYIAKRGEIRVVEDKSSTSLNEFGYHKLGQEKTTIYQYGLYYDPENHVTDKTVNCGMLYIIKLSDNSLFMIDGGHIRQWNEEAIEGLWQFLLKITNTKEDGIIRISGWYFTHAHDDHLNGCTKLLNRYHEQIILERVMYNFPCYALSTGYVLSTFDMKEIISKLYPQTKLLKLHTGQKFDIADMTVEVFYTHEDAAKKEELSKIHLGDSNCTSTILKLTIDGKTVMMLGDTNVETEEIIKKYSVKEIWKSDMVQVAHHCFNYLNTLYEWICAPVAILPNSYFAAHTENDNLPKLNSILKYVKDNQIYYEGEGTDAFVVTEEGWKQIECTPLIGGEYDYSGY